VESDTQGALDAELDAVDRGLLHALQVDPRLPFNRIGEVLGVSDQTVARRYRRLRASGTLRMVALPNPWQIGHSPWFVRLRCVPSSAAEIAAALAQRPDTAWVHLLSGGAEIDATVLPRDRDNEALLLQRVARTSRVVAVAAHAMLHIFTGSRTDVQAPVLSADQVAALRPERPGWPADLEPTALDSTDQALLDVLGRDARASHADLARATGWSESAVRRRLDWLLRTGLLFFQVDVDPKRLGLRTEARLWITVAPAKLDEVGEAISYHPEVPFVAATTGPTNLVASVYTRGPADLYHYLTGRLGALDGVQHVETSPIVRTLKRAGSPVGAP
jgi:DNA-binding Lrp family transcriptional regulator